MSAYVLVHVQSCLSLAFDKSGRMQEETTTTTVALQEGISTTKQEETTITTAKIVVAESDESVDDMPEVLSEPKPVSPQDTADILRQKHSPGKFM